MKTCKDCTFLKQQIISKQEIKSDKDIMIDKCSNQKTSYCHTFTFPCLGKCNYFNEYT